MPITTLGIGAAVTPTVVKTTFSHYLDRKPRAQKPTAHISYDQGLHLIRSFLLYASHHTVEEVQAFTAQWVPHPTWTRTENVHIPEENITKAAQLITAELGEEGIKAIGGPTWWHWRKKDTGLRAEWVEMRSDYNLRQRQKKKCRRIMLYVHGGAYFFGSVDEHRYQLQRHARKLQARVFAPRYRLAPQFPFPCGILDCLAAYLYLLTIHEPTEIIFAGDSAGGGMILSMLCILRDQQMPLPAGAILISPWVDLTHSFPSLSREDGLDYIPPHGFMQKPSRSWPPPNEDEIYEIVRAANDDGSKKSADHRRESSDDRKLSLPEAAKIAVRLQPPLSLQLDGKEYLVKDQVQMYTTNQLITHPLVSPILQPSLGGLPPLLIMVGDGELLRDEQIYIAHKAANPQKYRLNDLYRKRYDPDNTILEKYAPTPVQLQVWEDLCHVTPTLSFTRPAKFMYRSVAQFGAWALSRAQKRAIEIIDDDDDDSSSVSSDDEPRSNSTDLTNGKPTPNGLHAQVGRAGDSIPPFKNHMIREQIDRHGNIYPLPRSTELPAMQMSADMIGVVKEGPIRRWLTAKQEWDKKYHAQRRKIQKQRIAAYKQGNRLVYGENEVPPPSALAGRLLGSEAAKADRLKKSWGLGMWSSWGWKQDERNVQKDVEYFKQEKKNERSRSYAESSSDKDKSGRHDSHSASQGGVENRASLAARRKTVTVQDTGQLGDEEAQVLLQQQKETPEQFPAPNLAIDPPTPVAVDGTDEEHNTSPIFLPKWKQAQHLKTESKDISDAGSTYSRMTTQDNASTRAVFAGPGVQRQNSNLPEDSTTDADAVGEPPLSNFRPSTPGPKDNLGGYDTPGSNRSVERLHNNQLEIHDGQSGHSSLPVEAAGPNSRIDPIRSPSSMAIVHAEGVIDPIQEGSTANSDPQTTHVQQGSDDRGLQTSTVPAIAVVSTDRHTETRPAEAVENSSEQTAQRPGLYNRDSSKFVTAMEKL